MTPDLSGLPETLRPRHLAALFGVTPQRIAQRVREGTFPIPRLARESRNAWSKKDVEAYYAARTFERRSA